MNYWLAVGSVTTVLVVAVMIIRETVNIDGLIDDMADMLIKATPFVMRAMVCFVVAVGIVSTFWTLLS